MALKRKSIQSKFIFQKYIHEATRDVSVAETATLLQGLSWVPSTPIEGLTTTDNSSYRDLTPSSVFHGHMHICIDTHTHTQIKNESLMTST